MGQQAKEFTGVWIPRKIVEDSDLTWTDRAVYAEIACYEQCFASNAFLAKRVGIGERALQKITSKLVEMGYLERFGAGPKRVFVASLPRTTGRGNHEPQGVVTTNSSSPIDNSIDNNEITTSTAKPRGSKKKPEKEKTYNPLGAQVIEAFAQWNPACKRHYGNTTQRKACDDLIEHHGLERVLGAIRYIEATRGQKFMPTITTPKQLWDKWVNLENSASRESKPANSIGYV